MGGLYGWMGEWMDDVSTMCFYQSVFRLSLGPSVCVCLYVRAAGVTLPTGYRWFTLLRPPPGQPQLRSSLRSSEAQKPRPPRTGTGERQKPQLPGAERPGRGAAEATATAAGRTNRATRPRPEEPVILPGRSSQHIPWQGEPCRPQGCTRPDHNACFPLSLFPFL